MKLTPRFGLPERLLAILLLVAAIDFAANSLLFDRANNDALQRDASARVAEHLVLAVRAVQRVPADQRPALAKSLAIPAFSLAVLPQDAAGRAARDDDLLRSRMIAVSPELADGNLRVARARLHDGDEIAGSLDLHGGGTLTFRTYASKAQPLGVGWVLTLPA